MTEHEGRFRPAPRSGRQVDQQSPSGAGTHSAPPPAPASVVTAAVLALLIGAFGALSTLLVIVVGPVLFGQAWGLDNAEARTAARFGAGLTILVGLLLLAWTVAIIWGAVRALRGGGRTLLLVTASICLALMLAAFLATVTSRFVDPGSVAFTLTFLLGSTAVVVLVCLPSATRFFAAHRARRGG